MKRERKPNRLRNYDYTRDNLYFITSCVQDRICCFGEVVNGNMILNDYGKIAERQWHWLEEQYPYVVLHAFVVMPNHVHGIIEINRDHINRLAVAVVGTGRDLSLPPQPPTKIKSLSELIGAYKTTVSKQIHLSGYSAFKWQRSFHDRIIRHDRAFAHISGYIADNPSKWETDDFYDK